MRLTLSQLKKIIKEEVTRAMDEVANVPRPMIPLEVALNKAMPAIIAASELNENDTIENINSLSYDAWKEKDVTALAQLLAILDKVAQLRTTQLADMWYFDTQTMGSKGDIRTALAGPFKSQEDALNFIEVKLPTWFKSDNEEEPAGDFHHPRYGDW